jgi:parallel beta-helix repeat protein
MKRAKLYPFISILILVLLFTVSATSSQCSPVKEGQEGVTKESPQGQETTDQAQSGQEGVTKESPQGQGGVTKESPMEDQSGQEGVTKESPMEGQGQEEAKKSPQGQELAEQETEGEKKVKLVENTSLSGQFHESQIWSGNILITGDTEIKGDLTILPGTVVKFSVGDDIGSGSEVLADGYNDLDPTRLKSYETTHSSLFVNGKLTAKGTADKRITFTSASSEPYYADWVCIYINSDGSIMEYNTIEWSRNGITLGPNTPNTIIRNNMINYTFWGSISSDYSSAQIYGNEIRETGHEGIGVQGGNPIIENNKIYNAHVGIFISRDSATVRNNTMLNVGVGVGIAKGATPHIENNYVELAPDDSKLEWSYGNFSYVMFGDPKIK